MALVKTKTLLDDAHAGKYGVGAFNVANMEMIIGAIRAAEELDTPIILQIAEVRLNYSPLELIGPMMVAAAKNAKVPVAVHLDHGLTLETIKKALDLGFSSVMIDGSKLPLEENIELTKKVVKMAKEYDADVEAEIGVVGGSEDGTEKNEIKYTDLDEALRLAEETGIEAMAVAIGNAHGVYKKEPKLNFEILKKIHESLKETRLVLHGGSGISQEDFRKTIKNGITKLNVATATFLSVYDQVENQIDKINNYFELSETEVQGAYKNVKKHIKIFKTAKINRN
ncbi:MAG: class II fructose-bisphosphate aldolase [Fusobacterium sp. JB021]|nr:class II fructose-bisphosphate aldolase [Fusobacterium sp. JB021]MDP0506738.1 class II fructose-bisphosphate aldolase [Fusobacterium sp. JB019]